MEAVDDVLAELRVEDYRGWRAMGQEEKRPC